MEANRHSPKQSETRCSGAPGDAPQPGQPAAEGLRLDVTGFGGVKILQDPAGFCYGVDAVMIASFAAKICSRRRQAPGRLCDLGTGTGIIPLILSHKTAIPDMVGLDVLEENILLARRSTELNGLEHRIRFLTGNVTELRKGTPLLTQLGGEHSFDAVVSNPPYVPGTGGLRSEDRLRMVARHELLGSMDDFLAGASFLLKEKGDLFLVHRPSRMADVMAACREHRLEPKCLQLVSGKPGEVPNIMLLHCVKDGGRELAVLPQQHVREENGSYSAWMGGAYEKTD